MKSNAGTFAAALVLLAALPACEKRGPLEDPYCGDVKIATFDIIHGTSGHDPEVVALTPAQADAVGFLLIDGRLACTGTLIAPAAVVTAAHCLKTGPSSVEFKVGGDWRTAAHTYAAAGWHLHPDYRVGEVDHDLAVVLLARDPALDGVAPIPVHFTPLQSLLGLYVQAAGYGFTAAGDASNSRKWWVVLHVSNEQQTAYIASGDGTTGTCDGDSGGPLLWTHPEGGVRLFAVLSLGEAHTSCLGDSYYTRSDHASNGDFIRSYLPPDPCAGETFTGRCDSSAAAVYCTDEVVHRDECEADETCRVNAEGLYRCTPMGPCELERLDWTGACTGDGHARWCENGRVLDRDCWLCNQQCGWAGEALGWYCLD